MVINGLAELILVIAPLLIDLERFKFLIPNVFGVVFEKPQELPIFQNCDYMLLGE